MSFSDFICTFAMSFRVLFYIFPNTKLNEISDMLKSRTTFCCSEACEKRILNFSVAENRYICYKKVSYVGQVIMKVIR